MHVNNFWKDNPDICQRAEDLVLSGKSAGEVANYLAFEFGVTVTRNSVMGRMWRKGIPFTKQKHNNIGVNAVKRINKQTRAAKIKDAVLNFRSVSIPENIPPLPDLPPEPEFLNVEFFDLKSGMCRYAHGDNPYFFCGQVTPYAQSWCPYHRAIVFTKPRVINLSDEERERRRQAARKFPPESRMIGLTYTQQKVLRFMSQYATEYKRMPTMSEMAAKHNSNKSNIHRIILALEERGYIKRIPYRARAIELIPQTEAVALRAEIQEHLSMYANDHQITIETAANELLRASLGLT